MDRKHQGLVHQSSAVTDSEWEGERHCPGSSLWNARALFRMGLMGLAEECHRAPGLEAQGQTAAHGQDRKIQEDVRLGRLPFQHQDSQAQPPHYRQDCRPRQWYLQCLFPPQLNRPGQRICQPSATDQDRGVWCDSAAVSHWRQGLQVLQLPHRVWESWEGLQEHAVQLRPVQDVLPGADAEPCLLALLKALQSHLHLHLLLQHRLQAGSESLPGL